METHRIPAFANPAAGGAAQAIEALRADARFSLHETAPMALQDALRETLKQDPPTIVVAGGDGTISSVASLVVGTSTALCILRAGTLNHFARRIGVPADPREALELALTGETTRVDVGWVNDRIFLNTCVIGMYVRYVSKRERLKPKIGYVASSFAAGVRTLADFRHQRVELDIGRRGRAHVSAVLFVGVGERDFRVPMMGEPRDSGRRGLHVVVAKPLSRASLAMMMMRAAVRGIRPWPSDEHVDSFVVDSFQVGLLRPTEQITLDGEIVELAGRLSFRRQASALAVRVPPPGEGARDSNT